MFKIVFSKNVRGLEKSGNLEVVGKNFDIVDFFGKVLDYMILLNFFVAGIWGLKFIISIFVEFTQK